MPKVKTPKKTSKKLSPEQTTTVNNGLGGAIFGSGVPGAGHGFGGPGTQTVSQVGEIFNDLRWYFASNFRQALSEAYVELGLIQTIVDVPVDDALRGGVGVLSKLLSPEQLQELRNRMEREEDTVTYGQGVKWKRLFGGGGVLIITDEDPALPFDPTRLPMGANLAYRACDMWELSYDLQNMEGYNPVQHDEKFDYYSYYGTKIHKSRVIKLTGLVAPSFLRPRLRGWGFSVIESVIRSINQYLEGTNLIYELLDEAKIDVYQIKNLVNTLLSPTGQQQVAERIQLANRQKNYQHAIVMDAEDKYEQKSLTFSGLADVMKEVRMQVASDLRMPLTKLFGISAAGFSSGEDDIENYNAMVERTIRGSAKKDILQMVELRCQQMFGFIPEDLSIEFEPLRVLSKEQEETVKEKQFNRITAAYTSGMISLEQAQSAMNKENLIGVQLEPETLPEGSNEIAAPGEEGPEGSDNDSDTEDVSEFVPEESE